MTKALKIHKKLSDFIKIPGIAITSMANSRAQYGVCRIVLRGANTASSPLISRFAYPDCRPALSHMRVTDAQKSCTSILVR